MATIELTSKKCIECGGKLSEYEAEEYKGLCLECWTDMFRVDKHECI